MSGSSQHRTGQPLELPPLREAIVESRVIDTDDVDAFLAETHRVCASTGGDWNGLVYTTAGAFRVAALSESGMPVLIGGDFARETVYEIRLWAIPPKESGVLARELRWLNGSGGAEITVHSSSADTKGAARDEDGAAETASTRCWYRRNAYLQHVSSGSQPSSDNGDTSKIPSMSSIEVFREEEEFGNVTFIDELMTGRWQRP